MKIAGRRVLVTGGAGFIGSELCRQLRSAGAVVTIVDNLVNGRRENVDEILGPECRLEAEDIRNFALMESLLGAADVVFHLACLGVRHSLHSPAENHEVNATATLELLRMARAGGVRRFVYVSSSEVYGTALYVPQPEDHPTYPMTVYGAAKLAGECYARAYHRTYNFATVVLRPFNTYGPRCHHEGDSGEVIPRFLLRALAGKPMVIFGSGAQTRDFTYVSDTARGIMEAGLAEGAVGETINIGSGRELAISELANQIRAVTGREDAQVVHEPERPGDVMRLCADTSKAQRQVGFKTSVPLAEGLRRLLAWYDDDGRTPEQLLADDWVRNWEVRL